jgi:uncharacterized peroxidase-related enzyme
LKSQVGFIPNLAATMAESPTVLESFERVRSIVRRGTFTGPERETIALTLSFENACSYCMAAHSTFARFEAMPDDALAALRAGTVPREHARLAALSTFTRRLVQTRGHVASEDVEALRGAGFTRAQVLEVIAVVAQITIANLVHNLTHAALDPQFEPNAWKAVGRSAATAGANR